MVDLTERKVVQPTFLIHESTTTKYSSLFLLDYYLLQLKHLTGNNSSPHSPGFQSIHFGKTLASLRHHPLQKQEHCVLCQVSSSQCSHYTYHHRHFIKLECSSKLNHVQRKKCPIFSSTIFCLFNTNLLS